MRGMSLERMRVAHDAFYALPSEDQAGMYPYQFPQEIPFRDFDHVDEEDDDAV